MTTMETFLGAGMSVVLVPASCTSIGPHAFKNCENLFQIRVPEGCSIGTDAFDECVMVYVYGTAGSSAKVYCQEHANCEFVEDTQN